MVLSFFKKGPIGLDHVASRAVGMLSDARHSFDLATSAVLSGADWASLEVDVRDTDERINTAERELRSELVVHVAVQGADDIGTVLGFILLLKKIERVGDQAKNILDLAGEGVSLIDQPDHDELLDGARMISALFAEAIELMADPDEDRIEDYTGRILALNAGYQTKIHECMHSDAPAREVVPRAIYFRYLKRIVANLLGIVRTSNEPLPNVGYLDDGATDITDD